MASKKRRAVSDKMNDSRYNSEDNQEVVQYVNGTDMGEDVRPSDEQLMNARIKPLEDGLVDCKRQLGEINKSLVTIQHTLSSLQASTQIHEKHCQERRSRSFRVSMLLLSALIAALFGAIGFITSELL